VLVNIVLDSIEVGRTWDEFCLFEENLSCTDEELETYGSGAFYLISEDGSSQELATLEFWQEPGCGIFSSGCVGENIVYDHSEIDLGEEDIRLCPSDGACTGPGPGRNWVQTWVGEGDTVEFVFILWDHDDDSGDDIWCGTSDDAHFTFGQAEMGAETKPMIITTFHPENWPPLTERTGSWDNDGLDYQDSRCTVNVSVRSWETR
jgi:hypothetical protein